MEFVYRDNVTLEIKSSNGVYKLFANVGYDPFVSCIIRLNCGVVLSALGKSDHEIEAKNIAAYELLKKLSKIKKIFAS